VPERFAVHLNGNAIRSSSAHEYNSSDTTTT
jgi:hypothetical protein